MVEISVLIPVYRESELLRELLDTLLDQRMERKLYEIIVVIDEPTARSLAVIKKYRGKVKFIVNEKRLGKANALNTAVKHSSGNILLFLDSDVTLPKDKNYLKKIVREMRDADVLDIKKEVVKDSFLSTMTYYEYLGFDIGSWFVSAFVGKCPSLIGSAFAVRRDAFLSLKGFRNVVTEDVDIATRAFFKNYKFKYAKRIKVYNYVHSSWRNWFTQRKRWSIGAALWVKEYFKDLLKICVKKPQVFLPALLFLFPSIMLMLLYLFVPNMLIYKVFFLIFLLLAVKFNVVVPLLWLSTLSVDFVKGLVASLLTFFSFSAVFFVLSKKLDFRFRLHEFLVYYFFYSLLSLLIMLIALITVFLFDRKLTKTLSDWKV